MHQPHFHFHIANLLPRKLSRQAKELLASISILGFAMSVANLFEPIFLWTIGYSMPQIFVFYLITYGGYLLLMPFGMKFVGRFGSEKGLVLGAFLLIVYYVALFMIQREASLFFIAPVLFAVHKTFYWMGFYADFAKTASQGEEGREIGEANLFVTLASTLGPFLGAALIANGGFSIFFLVVALTIVFSNIPLLTTRERVRRVSVKYRDAWTNIATGANRRRFLAHLGFGDELLFMVVWPVFLYAATENVIGVGGIVTGASLLAATTLLFIGRSTDTGSRIALLGRGVRMLVLAWVFRVVTAVVPWLLAMDTAHRIGSGTVNMQILADTYSRARGGNTLQVMAHFEMGLVIGKLAILVFLVPLFLYAANPWPWAFLLGAAFAFLYRLFPLRQRIAKA